MTQPKRSPSPCPHTNHPLPKVELLPSNQLAVAIKPSRCRLVTPQYSDLFDKRIIPADSPCVHRATRLSAPSKSLPKLSVRTAPSPSGFVCAPATPSGKSRLALALEMLDRKKKRTLDTPNPTDPTCRAEKKLFARTNRLTGIPQIQRQATTLAQDPPGYLSAFQARLCTHPRPQIPNRRCCVRYEASYDVTPAPKRIFQSSTCALVMDYASLQLFLGLFDKPISDLTVFSS